MKRIETEHSKSPVGKISERIRNKRLRANLSLSAVAASLKDDDSELDAEQEEDEVKFL